MRLTVVVSVDPMGVAAAVAVSQQAYSSCIRKPKLPVVLLTLTGY